MSGTTSYYAILLTTMALFAALAAQGKEPASHERSAVLSAVRSGNQAAYMRALERYNARLSVEFAPKAKPIRKPASVSASSVAVAQPSNVAQAQPMGQPIGQPIAEVQTNLPDDSKKSQPSVKSEDAVTAALTPELKKNYEDCLKSGPAECCQPMIDPRASLPMSCVNRDIASEGTANSVSSSVANSAM